MDLVSVENVVLSFSYAGIFGLMVANGFFSFPSSQILYIVVGYFIGTGYLNIIAASTIGAIGNTIGNILLYEAVRKHGVRYIEHYRIFRKEDIQKVESVFKEKGLWFLFVGKLLPAIKVFIPIPAGIAKVHRGIFASIMLCASWLWSLIFIAIGYFFGKNAVLWKSYGIVLFIIALVVMGIFYRYMNKSEIIRGIPGKNRE